MQRISPKKLLNSKWTAVTPVGKAKHFLVVELEHDEDGAVTQCLIEAVITKRSWWLAWRELNNRDEWIQGWK